MSSKFNEYSSLDLSTLNQEIKEQWEKEDVFAKSIHLRKNAPKYIFFEGPPSANGMPGIHHVMARTIKDIFCRYKTMQGFRVDRKAGWDTHGLPVELGVEKKLGITKADIGTKISVEEYNNACREEVMKYTKEWCDLTEQMGYWVDMENPYITYENKYIESLWYLLKRLYEKGLLYKGYTIQPYSPAAGTGLSSHELNQPGTYRDVKDTTCTAQFEAIDLPEGLESEKNVYFLAWTTTPWTLPSNTALCVGKNIDYVAIRTYNPYSELPIVVILAQDLVSQYFKEEGLLSDISSYRREDKILPYRIVKTWKGSDLVGLRYRQLIPWIKAEEEAFRIISGDFVSTEEGTGIVHIAPTFGADDDKVAKASGTPPLLVVDKEGKPRPLVDLEGKLFLIEDMDEDFVKSRVDVSSYDIFAGRYVKNAFDPTSKENSSSLDTDICMLLKQEGLVFRIEKKIHSYPHCWRTDKPILYYPLDSWFIRTTSVQGRLIELNNTITWKPESTGTGRFGKWLENLQDWNLSRSRYWGTPLPIWRTEDSSEEICIGSVKELYSEIEKAVEAGIMTHNPLKDFAIGDNSDHNYRKIDLHRPYVDDIVLVSSDGKPMYRERDLIDVWFDSGAMPYAQCHYPFEHREDIEDRKMFPADFIAEGVDQTRGWFFTLHALSTMLFDSVAFKTVVSNGLVLDKNGNKMSKRLGNAVDPFQTLSAYGADPLRWYMISNSAPWENLKFDASGIEEVKRKFFNTLFNTYSFFTLYANLDEFDHTAPQIPIEDRPEIDKWIISALQTLVQQVTDNLDEYEPTRAIRLISEFVTSDLSNWYVRLTRKRFWLGGMTQDKLAAYQTLYTCLECLSRLIAPFAPFYADRLYRDLHKSDGSVHLTDYPIAQKSLIDSCLEDRMRYAQSISSLVLALRRKVNIKVRQPLQRVLILTSEMTERNAIEAVKDLILNEVNIKEILFSDDSSSIITKRVKPNFKALGPIFGKEMKAVASYIDSLSQDQISSLETTGSLLYKDGYPPIKLENVEIISEDIPGWLVLNEGGLSVALDVVITPELKNEGVARELVNRIQNIRKDQGYSVSDKIKVRLTSTPLLSTAIETYGEYIQSQVQAVSLELLPDFTSSLRLELDDIPLYIDVEKV